jgi:hypothetical protein
VSCNKLSPSLLFFALFFSPQSLILLFDFVNYSFDLSIISQTLNLITSFYAFFCGLAWLVLFVIQISCPLFSPPSEKRIERRIKWRRTHISSLDLDMRTRDHLHNNQRVGARIHATIRVLTALCSFFFAFVSLV